MHFKQNNFTPCPSYKINIIMALIITQAVLFFYLLALDVTAIVFFALLCAIPIALASRLLLTRKVRLLYVQMSVVMFAAGGFGMLLGCVADLGQLGVYGLLSICQLTPFSVSGWGVGTLWQKIQLTPWTYIGMFTCGNLGMLFLDNLRSNQALASLKFFYIYIICNFGMLFGMLLGESISSELIVYLNPFFAAGLMIILMLLGMVFGMLVFMVLANKLSKHTLLPLSLYYGNHRYDTVNRPL